MSNSANDPVLYLKSLVSKKGKSFSNGVYYTNPSVSVDANWDCPSYVIEQTRINRLVQDFFLGFFDGEEDESWRNLWNSVLVSLRLSDEEVDIHSIVAKDHLLEFISEDNDLTLKITVPHLDVPQFASEVLFYLGVLKRVAQFACKTPIGLRFSIGIASLDWDDVVGLGGARKVDVSF